MNTIISDVLVKRYAQAFLPFLLEHKEQEDMLVQLRLCAAYLRDQKSLFSYLKMSIIGDARKITLLGQIADRYGLKDLLHPLFLLLARTKRLVLIALIIAKLDDLYQQKIEMMHFSISSSSVLSEEQKMQIINYLEKKSHKKVEALYAVDTRLIAGFRAQSQEFLWQDSIAQKLKKIATAYSRR